MDTRAIRQALNEIQNQIEDQDFTDLGDDQHVNVLHTELCRKRDELIIALEDIQEYNMQGTAGTMTTGTDVSEGYSELESPLSVSVPGPAYAAGLSPPDTDAALEEMQAMRERIMMLEEKNRKLAESQAAEAKLQAENEQMRQVVGQLEQQKLQTLEAKAAEAKLQAEHESIQQTVLKLEQEKQQMLDEKKKLKLEQQEQVSRRNHQVWHSK